MNAALLLAHYERIAEAPDAIARLRRFILDLAVRGKLVEQDPNDEPASELLKRSQKKALTGRKAAMQDVMAEAPYDLPSSWNWVPVSAAFQYDAGRKVEPKALRSDAWLLELEDIEKDTGRLLYRSLVSERSPKSTKSEFAAGDVLYGKLRPYLNKVIVAGEDGYSTTEIVALRPLVDAYAPYCALAFRRPDYVDYVSRLGQGTKMPRLRTEDALISPFPLPPLAEQQRIATKVDELMALCDQLETAQSDRETGRGKLTLSTLAKLNEPDPEAFADDARFALEHLEPLTKRTGQIKQLRQTILNLAVRGKLVAQDPNDEPASELIGGIQDDVAAISASLGLKRPATLPRIDATDAPFELPKGWVWARFPEAGAFGRGRSKHRPRNDPALYSDGKHLMIQTGDVARSRGEIQTFSAKYNDVGLAQSRLWPKGTLCITIAANIADSGILGFAACFPDSVVGFVPAACFDNARYFEYFMRTAKADLLAFAPATAQKNINLDILMQVLIPLPPLAEQHRIVAKVDKLMALCNQLEASLVEGEQTRSKLLEAVLHQALEPA